MRAHCAGHANSAFPTPERRALDGFIQITEASTLGASPLAELTVPSPIHDIGEDTMTRHAQIPDSRITWPPRHSPSSSIVFAQNTIEIAAPPEKVWLALIDCVRWPSWYKHCADVSVLRGGPVLSAEGKFRFKTIGFYFEPDVVTFSPYRVLIWLAKGPAGTSGAHAWYIEPTPGGCRVVTEEAQRGFLLRSDVLLQGLVAHQFARAEFPDGSHH